MKKITFTAAIIFCMAVMQAQAFDTIVYVMDTAVYNQIDGKGLKQGHWQKKYPNGKLAYRAYFVDDRPLGLLVRYHENGQKMAVIDYFDDGTAFAQLFSPQGALIAEGHYRGENAKHGEWKYFRAGKLVMDEQYERGKLHGASHLYYPDGKIYERKHFKRGEQTGIYEQLDVRGQLVFELMYEAGVQNGNAHYYYDNNQLRIEGQYKDGVRIGEWTFYETNGKVERKTTYTDGVAADKDEIDKKNSDYLKQMDEQRGRFIEPEDRLNEQ
jgi:antitoxin component YwqK of YwqJK toxin-antitoxin module